MTIVYVILLSFLLGTCFTTLFGVRQESLIIIPIIFIGLFLVLSVSGHMKSIKNNNHCTLLCEDINAEMKAKECWIPLYGEDQKGWEKCSFGR